MRLKKFNKEKKLKSLKYKKQKNKYIKRINIILSILVLFVGVFYITYAIYNSTKEFTIIDATVKNFYKLSFSSPNLLVHFDDKETTLSNKMNYSINNGVVTVNAIEDDGWGAIGAYAYLEKGKKYHFNCVTDGTWGFKPATDTVEAFMLLDNQVITWVNMKSNDYTFSVSEDGNYYLRLDVNQKGKTYTFSDISITEVFDTKKVYQNKKYNTLPIPTKKEGFVFEGWFTDEGNGYLKNENSIFEDDKNQTLYASYKKSSILTIDPNGGYYDSSTDKKEIQYPIGDYYTLSTPTKEGYNFLGWELIGSGNLMKGLDANNPKFLNYFTKTKKTDMYNYTNFNLNVSCQNECWPSVRYQPYSYELGHEYEISFYTRINKIHNSSYEDNIAFRHSIVDNDYDSPNRVAWVTETTRNTWKKGVLKRTINEQNTIQNNEELNVSPRFEIFANTIKEESIYDFDIRDIVIKDLTSNTYIFDDVDIFEFGDDNATLKANWEKITSE